MGAPTLGGDQHKILPNFPKKLHEIERIWTPGVIETKYNVYEKPHVPMTVAEALVATSAGDSSRLTDSAGPTAHGAYVYT